MKPVSTSLLLCFACAAVSCSSQSFETPPQSSQRESKTIEEKMAYKIQTDALIDMATNSVSSVQELLEGLQKADPGFFKSPESPFESVKLLLKRLKTSMPVILENQLVRSVKTSVPIFPGCATTEVRLKTDVSQPGVTEANLFSLTAQSCHDQTFHELATFTGDLSSSNVKLNNEFVSSSLTDVANSALQTSDNTTSCSVAKSSKRIVESVECKTLVLKLSSTDVCVVSNARLNLKGDIRLEATGDLYRSGVKILSQTLKLFLNGSKEQSVVETPVEQI